MFLYWLILLAAVFLSFNQRQHSDIHIYSKSRLGFDCICLVLFFVIGLRYGVGGDWKNYYVLNQGAIGQPLSSIQTSGTTEFAYAFFNWIGANIFGGVYFPNLICAAILTIGLRKFCITLTNPALGLVVAIPYLMLVVGQTVLKNF